MKHLESPHGLSKDAKLLTPEMLSLKGKVHWKKFCHCLFSYPSKHVWLFFCWDVSQNVQAAFFQEHKRKHISHFRDSLIDYGEIKQRKVSLQCLQILLVLTKLWKFLFILTVHVENDIPHMLVLQFLRHCGFVDKKGSRWLSAIPLMSLFAVVVVSWFSGHWHVLKTKLDLN